MFPFPKMKPFRGFMKLVFWGCKCLSDCCWWWCSCLVCLVVLCQALFQLAWLFRYMFLFFEAMFLSNSVLTPYAWNHLQPQSTRVETQRFLCIFNLGFIVACSWQHVEYCCRSGQHGFKQHRRKQDESRPWPCSSWARMMISTTGMDIYGWSQNTTAKKPPLGWSVGFLVTRLMLSHEGQFTAIYSLFLVSNRSIPRSSFHHWDVSFALSMHA